MTCASSAATRDTWHLKQDVGPCDDTTEHWVILEPEHVATLAGMAGFVPAAEINHETERLRDRLDLLAALIHAHTKNGDPLRAAVACLLDGEATKLVAPTNQNGCATLPEPFEDPSQHTGQLPLEMNQ